jgi:aldehyde dehydrogenase (NAD+)
MASDSTAPARYDGFDRMPIASAWRAGRAGKTVTDTEYGLSSAVFTEDTLRGVNFALRVEAGMTHVNDSPLNDENNTAFGGEKDSGLGRFGGEWAIDEFTTDHWVSVQHTKRTFPF